MSVVGHVLGLGDRHLNNMLLDRLTIPSQEAIPDPVWRAFSESQNLCGRSLAVMSVVGHVLGLGDRHLNNILLDPALTDYVITDRDSSFCVAGVLKDVHHVWQEPGCDECGGARVGAGRPSLEQHSAGPGPR
jgi:hypothetical protein